MISLSRRLNSGFLGIVTSRGAEVLKNQQVLKI